MNARTAKEMVGVIRAERDRRIASLQEEDPSCRRDRWLFDDEPFINELCMCVLVAVRHQLERELVLLAAKTEGGIEITREPDSRHFREALARHLGLEPDADYCAITEVFIDRVSGFIDQVQQQPGISPVTWGPVSLVEFEG